MGGALVVSIALSFIAREGNVKINAAYVCSLTRF